ncbi:unnamed protein product [Durusdinium trenchii]|uniref:Isochorismatase-like domain-containing protein n=1 Tax=Durusdinium trenchii TaxID=1381693 RepID=A0ABP0JHM3_9DINO
MSWWLLARGSSTVHGSSAAPRKDFLDVGGFGHALGNDVTKLADECLPGAGKLLDAARKLPLAAIIHTKEAHREDLADCCEMKLCGPRCPPEDKRIGQVMVEGMGRLLVDGSPGNDFVDAAKPLDGEIVVPKPGKGAFFMTGLNEILRDKGVSHLIVCGVTTEVCVQTTMREANDRGYECVLVEDATASYIPKFKASVIEMVRSQGGIVGYTVEQAEVPEYVFVAFERGGESPECSGVRTWFPRFPRAQRDPSTTAIDGKPEVSSAETMETYDEAEKHLDNGDLQLCVRSAEDALAESHNAGRPPVALHLLVRAKKRLGAPAGDLVREASEKARSQEMPWKAAVKLAEISLSLGESRLSDAIEEAKDLRSLAAELPAAEGKLHRLTLSIQVTVQLARGALDEAMRAAMELLAAAQRRQDKGAEAGAWLRIAEVHRHREMMTGSSATASTAEETLQASERSAELYRGAAGAGVDAAAELRRGVGSAQVEAASACVRLGRLRQSISLATEAMGVFRSLGFLHRLTGALDVELEARRQLMEPMIGLQAANRELQLLRENKGDGEATRGFSQAEAEILEAIARTHGALSEPLGAVRNALLAAELRKEIQDEVGETSALLLAADQQRNLGEMIDATETAERALALARKTSHARHEEEAARVLSRVLAERGLNDQAPQRPQALQALEALISAVKLRDGAAAKDSERMLNSYGNLVTNKDIADHVVPLISRDPDSVKFLRCMVFGRRGGADGRAEGGAGLEHREAIHPEAEWQGDPALGLLLGTPTLRYGFRPSVQSVRHALARLGLHAGGGVGESAPRDRGMADGDDVPSRLHRCRPAVRHGACALL